MWMKSINIDLLRILFILNDYFIYNFYDYRLNLNLIGDVGFDSFHFRVLLNNDQFQINPDYCFLKSLLNCACINRCFIKIYFYH